MSSFIECHYCGQQRNKNISEGFVAKCCIKRCSKYYCIECIRKQFNPEFQQNCYRKDTWICYFCQDSCNCFKCKNQETLERKPSKRKLTKSVKINDESGELQSASNISLSVNNSKVAEPVQVPQKIDMEEQQSIQQNVISQTNIHEQMMISADEMLLLPPFMKKIAERKNMYYQFMSNYRKKEGKKTEQKSNNKKIKQIIQNAINQRKGNSGEIDIELQQ